MTRHQGQGHRNQHEHIYIYIMHTSTVTPIVLMYYNLNICQVLEAGMTLSEDNRTDKDYIYRALVGLYAQ